MFEEIKAESSDNSSFSDNPRETDDNSCVDFNYQPSRPTEALTNDSTRLENRKRKLKTYYSHSEAMLVAENLREESTFNEALLTLKTWLEKGECTKQNASDFYSLIQSVYAHVNYLQQKKEDYTEKMSNGESHLIQHIQNSVVLFETIKTIFNLAQEQKVQNLFTKVQRNDIKKTKEVIEKCQENLMEELAFRDKVNVPKDNILNYRHLKEENFDMSPEQGKLQEEKEKLLDEKNRICAQLAAIQEEKKRLRSQLAASNEEQTPKVNASNFGIHKQARLIAVISPFLYVHRDVGQSVAVITSHLKYMGFDVGEQEVEDILTNHPSVFQKCVTGKGTSGEKRWIFCGYQR